MMKHTELKCIDNIGRKIKYTLVRIDGNAFSVMGYVRRCMRECNCTNEEMKDYTSRAMSGDYNNLLCVSVEIIDKLNEINGKR